MRMSFTSSSLGSVGTLWLSGLLLSGCFHATEVSDINCKDNASCPSGYVCVRPGQPGGCERMTDGGTDALVVDGSQAAEDAQADVGPRIDASPLLDVGSDRSSTALDQAIELPGDSAGKASEAGFIPDIPQPPVDLGLGGAGGQGGGSDGVGGSPGAGGIGGSGGTIADVGERDVPIGGSGGTGGGAVGGSGGGTGGIATGGNGNSTGGSGAGGIGTGGSGTGGSSTGGSGTGGSGTGGSGTGGSSTGGSGTGGSGTGGSGTGGSGTGGSGTGGTLARPPGYWMASDWGLTDVNWGGCVWAVPYDEAGASSPTSISPADFTTNHQPSDPYHVAGSVMNAYTSVAVLGFNLTESITGASNQCVHKTLDSTTILSPGVLLPTNTVGFTIDWRQTTASQVRIELRGADGFANSAHRWCVTIDTLGHPALVPISAFSTQCWNPALPGDYNGEAISAIVFYVPGVAGAHPQAFDFTVDAFAAVR